jgi:hypothetical protein
MLLVPVERDNTVERRLSAVDNTGITGPGERCVVLVVKNLSRFSHKKKWVLAWNELFSTSSAAKITSHVP